MPFESFVLEPWDIPKEFFRHGIPREIFPDESTSFQGDFFQFFGMCPTPIYHFQYSFYRAIVSYVVFPGYHADIPVHRRFFSYVGTTTSHSFYEANSGEVAQFLTAYEHFMLVETLDDIEYEVRMLLSVEDFV